MYFICLLSVYDEKKGVSWIHGMRSAVEACIQRQTFPPETTVQQCWSQPVTWQPVYTWCRHCLVSQKHQIGKLHSTGWMCSQFWAPTLGSHLRPGLPQHCRSAALIHSSCQCLLMSSGPWERRCPRRLPLPITSCLSSISLAFTEAWDLPRPLVLYGWWNST